MDFVDVLIITVYIAIILIGFFLLGIGIIGISEEKKLKVELKQERLNIISDEAFSEHKYLKGRVWDETVHTFCMLNEKGNFYFHPEKVRFDIKDVDLVDIIFNGEVSKGLKGAIAGGLLFGGLGAIAGYLATKSNTAKQIGLRFNLDSFERPTFDFYFLNEGSNYSINDERVISAKKRLYDFLSHVLIVDRRSNKSKLFGAIKKVEELSNTPDTEVVL